MSDAGMRFWHVLMGSRNFSGLYCMGLHTKDASCTDPKMTIGSAADSMYEYMLKQWLLSGGRQEVSSRVWGTICAVLCCLAHLAVHVHRPPVCMLMPNGRHLSAVLAQH
jgi:hypothetical protein